MKSRRKVTGREKTGHSSQVQQNLYPGQPFTSTHCEIGLGNPFKFEGIFSLFFGIAAALENRAIVVTRNLRDFQQVPGLSVQDRTV
jgi:hypothetical protein